MKRLLICALLVLSACAVPQDDQAPLEAPVVMAPAMEVRSDGCQPGDTAMQDGIGGTGCPVN